MSQAFFIDLPDTTQKACAVCAAMSDSLQACNVSAGGHFVDLRGPVLCLRGPASILNPWNTIGPENL